jgi:ABC-type amino acid transport substrate-binding protein
MRAWISALSSILLWAVIGLSPAQGQSFDSSVLEDRNLDEVKETGFIEIAVYRDFPPYSFLDDSGQPAGIDIAVGKLIAEGLGVEPVWYWVTPDESLDGDLRNAIWRGSLLDRSVADVMLRVPYDRNFAYARDGYGLPKFEHVVMFGPYQSEGWLMARDLEKTGAVRNLAIFRFEKVGVEIAGLPDTVLSGAYNGQLRDNVVHYSNVAQAVDGLRAGEVAAVVGMRSQLQYALRDDVGRFDLDDDGLQELVHLSWDIGAAVKENHRELAYAIEDVLMKAYADGRLAQAIEEYGVEYKAPSTLVNTE